MFVSEELPDIDNINSCISYFSINKATKDGKLYGLEFSLDEEKDIYIGWCADLSQGSATQEFRISEVALLKKIEDNIIDQNEVFVIENENLEINNQRFSEIIDLTPVITSNNIPYIKGSYNGEIDLGFIDFGNNEIKKMFIKTASTSSFSTSSTYDIYINNDQNPYLHIHL